jgi:hypothetical protein
LQSWYHDIDHFITSPTILASTKGMIKFSLFLVVTYNTLTNFCYSNLLKDCNAKPTEISRCTCYIRKMASILILVSFILVPRSPEPPRFSPYPDQMVDQHLEMTFTALNISGDQNNSMSPRDLSPVKTMSQTAIRTRPQEPDESCTIWLCCSLELNCCKKCCI